MIRVRVVYLLLPRGPHAAHTYTQTPMQTNNTDNARDGAQGSLAPTFGSGQQRAQAHTRTAHEVESALKSELKELREARKVERAAEKEVMAELARLEEAVEKRCKEIKRLQGLNAEDEGRMAELEDQLSDMDDAHTQTRIELESVRAALEAVQMQPRRKVRARRS